MIVFGSIASVGVPIIGPPSFVVAAPYGVIKCDGVADRMSGPPCGCPPGSITAGAFDPCGPTFN